MSGSSAKKCPKCEEEMKRATLGGVENDGVPMYIGLFLELWGKNWHEILPFYCSSCGYIELYKEMKKKRE